MNDNELSVPKKKKIAENNSQPTPEAAAVAVTKKTAKSQRDRRATTVKKQRKPRITKATTTGATEISASPRNEASELIEFSEDTIRLRAYYISERRRRFALPGDAESDWLEAKRQLLAETRH